MTEMSGWWACADGDEFPSLSDAIEHLRMVDVNDTGRGRVRAIIWGPWQEVDLNSPLAEPFITSAASGDPVARETTPPSTASEQTARRLKDDA